jgi:hypothetical protein
LATSSYQKRKKIYSIPSCNLKLPALSFTPRFLVVHDDNDVEATNILINGQRPTRSQSQNPTRRLHQLDVKAIIHSPTRRQSHCPFTNSTFHPVTNNTLKLASIVVTHFQANYTSVTFIDNITTSTSQPVADDTSKPTSNATTHLQANYTTVTFTD